MSGMVPPPSGDRRGDAVSAVAAAPRGSQAMQADRAHRTPRRVAPSWTPSAGQESSLSRGSAQVRSVCLRPEELGCATEDSVARAVNCRRVTRTFEAADERGREARGHVRAGHPVWGPRAVWRFGCGRAREWQVHSPPTATRSWSGRVRRGAGRGHSSQLTASRCGVRCAVGNAAGCPRKTTPTIVHSSSAPRSRARPGSRVRRPVLQPRQRPSATAARAMF